MSHERRLPLAEAKEPITRADVVAATRAATQRGVLSAAELHACGLDDQAILVRVRNGRLHKRHRGVYVLGHPSLSLEGRFLAAVKACGLDAVLSHFSAAVLWALLKWDNRYPEVTAPTLRRHPGIYTHRSNTIERTFHKGIPVTTPTRTLIDLSSMLPFKPMRRAVNEALNQRLVTLPELVTTHHRGANRLREILATAAPTRNEFEDVVHAILQGLPKPDTNQPLHFPDRTYYPDFRWPAAKLILEADSAEFHDQPLARADDKERQAFLEAHGERILHVTWRQATTKPSQTRARIRQALGEVP